MTCGSRFSQIRAAPLARVTLSGNCGSFSRWLLTIGRVTIPSSLPTSSMGTASAKSKRDTSACRMTFVLGYVSMSCGGVGAEGETHS